MRRVTFVAIMLLLAISPLLIAEGWLRATRAPLDLWAKTGRTPGSNPIRAWGVIDAFSAYRARPGIYSANKTVNESGFISTPEITVAKPQGALRVVFLGESSTAGTGVNLDDRDTWPWRTAELLRARFPGRTIEFINGALGGFTSFESYGRLWSRIRFFSPDIIVVCHGWNEMYYFGKVETITSWRTLQDGDWTFDRMDNAIAEYRPLLIDNLIWPSQFLVRVRLRLSKRSDGEVRAPMPLATTFDQRGVEIWRTNLRLIRETAPVIGAELFVIKQPTLIVPDLPAAERSRIGYGLHGFDHDAHLQAFRDVYRVIDNEIRADRIIDATILSGRPEYFHDHVHPTQRGAAAIARVVAHALAPYVATMSPLR